MREQETTGTTSACQKAIAVLCSGAFVLAMSPMTAFADNQPSVGPQTGTGVTNLTMIYEKGGEYGGTSEPENIPNPDYDPTNAESPENIPNPNYNPDDDDDTLGDNLQFTVPSVINYVVSPTGQLTGPDGIFVENRSIVPIHASSLKVTPATGWNFVADASAESDLTNRVDLQIGPEGHMANASSFLEGRKTSISDPENWNMEATDGNIGTGDDTLQMTTAGDVANVNVDLTQQQTFGEIHWYMTIGAAS